MQWQFPPKRTNGAGRALGGSTDLKRLSFLNLERRPANDQIQVLRIAQMQALRIAQVRVLRIAQIPVLRIA